jgi:hypothetical protein
MTRRIAGTIRVTLLVLAIAAPVVAIRIAIEPEESPAPVVDLSVSSMRKMAASCEQSRVDEARLFADLATTDVLLVGEEHFYRETNEFLTRMLESIGTRRVSILLEIPSNLQPAVDAWVSTGSSAAYDAAVSKGDALPFQYILEWAHRNRTRITRVVAVDETRGRIFLNRALLRETRNRTMADAVLASVGGASRELVVIYGGQLHMTLAGRYRYDLENRTPAGALLLQKLERRRIRSVMLSGKGKSPASDILPPGIYAASSAAGESPYAWFINYPIFRAARARELFDYYVVLGDLTRIR